MSNVRICINIPEGLYKKLEEKAKLYNVTVNELLIMAITVALDTL